MKIPKLPKLPPLRKKPQIQALSFSEMRIKEKKSIKKRFRNFFVFLGHLSWYLQKKYTRFVNLSVNRSAKFFTFIFGLKGIFTTKLIWGRGRLGKPLLHVGTLILALSVFLTGGLFQSKLIVLSNEEREVFFASESDIVPQTVLLATDSPSANRNSVTEYTIKTGDTLSSVGKKFGVTVDTIRYANNITNIAYLKVGQTIEIPPVNGVVYEVRAGDSLASVAEKFGVAEQAIADFNYLSKPFTLSKGQTLILPDASIPAPVVAAVPSAVPNTTTGDYYTGAAYTYIPYSSTGRTGTGSFLWPTNSRVITQYFSWYHPGVDIGVPSPIYASDSGVVIRSGWWTNGYGFAVQIDHRNGFVTTYAHMSQLNVSVGQEVGKGYVIGQMGSTGRSTGPHVHFTIHKNGSFVNPLEYL